jgi:hypothetical protein
LASWRWPTAAAALTTVTSISAAVATAAVSAAY